MRVRAYVPLILLVLLACAPSARAADPTVSGTVDAAVAAGAVTPEQGAAYKATYTRARGVVGDLPASRKKELRGAMSIIEGLVKRRALPAARMPAAFTQLERNVEWWTANGPPGSSAATGGLPRVTFPGDPIVLQWYPGQGLAIQWLATFGKANALAAAGKTDELRLLLDRATALAGRRGTGWVAWEYLLAFGGGRAPWVSGIAQGTGIQAFTRGAQLLGNPAYLETARGALGAFEAAPPDRDRDRRRRRAALPPLLVRAPDEGPQRVPAVARGHPATSRTSPATRGRGPSTTWATSRRSASCPRFDTGAWSLYAQGGAESTLNYHQLVTGFLGSLCARTANPAYCATQTRFTTYLHQPPRVSISFDGPRRVRRTMARARHALEGLLRRAAHPAREPRDRRAGRHPGPRDAHVQARAEPPRHAGRRRPGPRPRRQRRGRDPHGAGLSEVLAAAPVRGLTGRTGRMCAEPERSELRMRR